MQSDTISGSPQLVRVHWEHLSMLSLDIGSSNERTVDGRKKGRQVRKVLIGATPYFASDGMRR